MTRTKAKIFIVDDEPDVRVTVGRMLEHDYQIVLLDSAEAAKQRARDGAPDLCVLDVVLKGVDGFELLTWFRAHHPETEVIVITGDTYDADAKLARALRGEAFYFLTKPFERVALQALVRRCLTTRALRQELERRNRELERELVLAKEFQARLMPAGDLIVDDVVLRALFTPCDALAGDFYDYRAQKKWFYFWVADVVGHGVGAAMLTGMLSSTWARAVRESLDLGTVHKRLHDLTQEWEDHQWFSAFLGRYDRETNELRYVNAGHPAGWLADETRNVSELGATAPLVSPAFPYIEPEVKSLAFKPGSRLMVLTDGMLEARDADGQFFGEDRVLDVLKTAGRDPLHELEDAVLKHSGMRPVEDDYTALLLERRAFS